MTRENWSKVLSRLNLLIIDELGFVPLSPTGAEPLVEVFGSERLTRALLDRLTHHVHILETNGESYRRRAAGRTPSPSPWTNLTTLSPASSLYPTHRKSLPGLQCGCFYPHRWDTIPPPRWSTMSPPLT